MGNHYNSKVDFLYMRFEIWYADDGDMRFTPTQAIPHPFTKEDHIYLSMLNKQAYSDRMQSDPKHHRILLRLLCEWLFSQKKSTLILLMVDEFRKCCFRAKRHREFIEFGLKFVQSETYSGMIKEDSYRLWLGSIHGRLGEAYESIEKPALAALQYEIDLQIISSTSDKSQIAAIHNNLGLAYKNAGRFDIAIEQYRKSLAIAPSEDAVYNLRMAQIEADWGD